MLTRNGVQQGGLPEPSNLSSVVLYFFSRVVTDERQILLRCQVSECGTQTPPLPKPPPPPKVVPSVTPAQIRLAVNTAASPLRATVAELEGLVRTAIRLAQDTREAQRVAAAERAGIMEQLEQLTQLTKV